MQTVALQKEDVGKAVVVVIEDRHPSACVFHDVGLIDLAGNHFSGESCLRRDIAEIHLRCLSFLEGEDAQAHPLRSPKPSAKTASVREPARAHIAATIAASGTSPRIISIIAPSQRRIRRTAFVPGQSSQGRVGSRDQWV